MTKFILGAIFGASMALLVMALLKANEEPDATGGEDLGELDTFVQADVLRDVLQNHAAFEPADNFLKDCPPVCGNCEHWTRELYAWGNVQICGICNRPRNAGQVCDIRDGEVTQ